ncbi:MAG: hypothetical protein M3N97_11335 [Pseudomonadota bacterium]|nr:hypothetical protein [Pseudomonadota bacterium]
MTRTRLLVALLVMVILLQLFPDRAAVIKLVAVGAGALYALGWALAKYRAQRRTKAALAAQEAADAEEYRQYEMELRALREKHDPHGEGADLDAVTPEYRAELSALHDRHEAMLNRKFGAR